MLCLKIAGWLANSEDPDETPQNAASHLGLHCLLRPVCPNTYSKYGKLHQNCFCLPSETGYNLKGTNSYHLDNFQKRLGVQKSKQEVTKVIFLKNCRQSTKCKQLPFLNQWKGENDGRKYFMIPTIECGQTQQGSNPQPPDHQLVAHLTASHWGLLH